VKQYKFVISNSENQDTIEFLSTAGVLSYFKEKYNYKIPNYLREAVKNHGDAINLTINNIKFVVSRV